MHELIKRKTSKIFSSNCAVMVLYPDELSTVELDDSAVTLKKKVLFRKDLIMIRVQYMRDGDLWRRNAAACLGLRHAAKAAKNSKDALQDNRMCPL